MRSLQIDKGVPVPKMKRGPQRCTKYEPLRLAIMRMHIGDSVVWPVPYQRGRVNSIQQLARRYNRRVEVRRDPKGMRVWLTVKNLTVAIVKQQERIKRLRAV